MTVVFDAGQNSAARFAAWRASLRYVGSVPASDCAGPDRAARQSACNSG